MAVIILARSSQNYPSVSPTPQDGFWESQNFGFLLLYPSHHLGSPSWTILEPDFSSLILPENDILFQLSQDFYQ
jgi:hypothetical protein